ncbi:ABC-three component system protein [Cellulophaga sp. Z1A5H]|uniref:ABC-three component system protein n=1 Tax=Cellulophaga sp. Z1A5H TaxID=2687291 RepID=UPI0013FD345F|nr:ABC-three component system protein [Cellulophaga sp. Z1A5H]
MIKNTLTDAPGQMLGYLFQIERAVFWLSELKTGGFVGIECGDDIVLKKNVNGENEIYEQDKSSISSKLPYSDLSSDLWKTLGIWLDKIKTSSIDIEDCHFFMVSNRKIPTNRLVWKFSNADNETELDICISLLREIGAKHTGKMTPIISKVLSYKDIELKELIRKIKVFDNASSKQPMFKEGIRNNMKIGKEVPFDNIYQNFIGWAFENIVDCWNSKNDAWLEVDSFISLSNRLITQYSNRPFIERTIENLPVSGKDVKSHKTENFVKQLEQIDADDDEKIMAINDYLRASSEKTRFAKEANITIQDWKQFEGNLIDRWDMIFKPTCRLSESSSDEKKGYEIYYKTLIHKEKLCGIDTEQNYTTRGAYHRLANKIIIGWHPLWKKLFI